MAPSFFRSCQWPPLIVILVWFALTMGRAFCGVLVNNAQPITKRVTVQIVQTAASDGTDAAPMFGTPAQQTAIFEEINQIWAQAGVEIDFAFRPTTWNWDFGLIGTPGKNNPRPGTDLLTIVTAASQFRVTDSDPSVINVYLVRIVPGFAQTSDNTCNGQSLNGQNGVTLWVGPNTPTTAAGVDLVSHILAHELGLNLGLMEITGNPNLMLPVYSPGEYLTVSQDSTVQVSPFAATVNPTSADPQVAVASPSDQGITLEPQVLIQGTSADARGISGINVNGVAATSTDSFATWSAALSGLTPGMNTLTVTATDAVTPGNSVSIPWHIYYAVPPVPAIEANPADGLLYLTFTYHRLITSNTITYNVEVSGDLVKWNSDPANYEEISAPVADPNGVMEMVRLRILPAANVPGNSAKFVRLRVTTISN